MPYKKLWENGVVLSFDLDTKMLRRYYSDKSPKNAYGEIKKMLKREGFEHKKDSDYVNEEIDKVKTVIIIEEFSQENKWFPLCVNKINISPNV